MKAKPRSLSLEFALRDFFGLIDEPIELDEATLARALREIAVEDGRDLAAYAVLMSTAEGLTSSRAEWQLTLRNRRTGKRPLHHDKEAKDARDLDLFVAVENARGNDGKVEAGLQKVMEAQGISRSELQKARSRFLKRQAMLETVSAKLVTTLGLSEDNDDLFADSLGIIDNMETGISWHSAHDPMISRLTVKSGPAQTQEYTWTVCFAPSPTQVRRSG